MGITWKARKCRCGPEIRPIVDPIHAILKNKHKCHKDHTPHYYDGKRLNQYIQSILPNNSPPPPKWFKNNNQPTYKICNNLHKQIELKLGPIDRDNINKEEEALAKKSRYNLRSLDLDQIKFVVDDNQCIVIEEEEEEEVASAPTRTNHRSK